MTHRAPAPSNPGGPAIDRSVLGEWLAGDNAAIDALLVVFRDSIGAECKHLRDALNAGQLDAFADAAHRLRGAALAMGARPLAEFAGLLFNAAQAQNGQSCTEGMVELERRTRLLFAELPARGSQLG